MSITDENIMARAPVRKGVRKALAEVQNRKKAQDTEIGKIERPVKKGVEYLEEYAEGILEWYRSQEASFKPIASYMTFQEELRWAMRTVLIDWIIDVHNKLSLLPETLYLAINLIDRFLSIRVVSLGKLQLVGVSGLLIASKYQEITSPSIATLVIITDRSFTENEILRAEKYMLHCLEYRIGFPSPLNWLRRCVRGAEEEKIGMLILDMTLLDERFIAFSPSVLGCAAVYVALQTLKQESLGALGQESSSFFLSRSSYTVKQLEPCVSGIRQYLSKSVVLHSIQKKYGGATRYLEALVLEPGAQNK